MALSQRQIELIQEKEQFVMENYTKMTVKEIALKIGMSVSGTHKLIERVGLKEIEINYNRTVNEFVEENEHWFYFVGLMLADGAISNNTIEINLSIDDKQILDDIANWLNLKTEVHVYKSPSNRKSSKPRCFIAFNSKVIISRLRYYGLSERKTGKEDYCNIPDEYYLDFLRGFMDGDGCTSGRRVALYSNESLIRKIEEDVHRLTGIHGCVGYCSSLVWRVTYTKKNSRTLYQRMYKENSLFLVRKEQSLRG